MQDTKDTLDFIVIGAQKAGTTSLFEYLKHHPELCLAPGKEAPYFSHDAVSAQGWDSYIRKYFAGADPMRKWGTVTPSYMVGGVYDAVNLSRSSDSNYDESTVPTRICERLPDIRLIAILRDPVKRAQSHHRMLMLNGLERRSFDDAISDLLRPEILERSRRLPEETAGYVTWGEYGRILTGYLNVFAREQILVLFTDELERSPEQLLLRVYKFLGTSAFVPDNLGTRYRASSTDRRVSWLKIGDARRAVAQSSAARSLWRSMPDLVRHPLDRGYERAVYRLDLWNRRDSIIADEPSPATLHRLCEHFSADINLLAAQFEVDPPWLIQEADR